ncbi:hypothetical protein AaE_014459 [Aphanomyces astaci]|uniref:Tc1-like transposase DDE domain-containing protein n=1 Tax=Aphanomyces astaci TaxID=112090 RepID=A0A6A4Z6U9_APHAT|nr:hypothetical protein AaE_014459 [Aphanomyces astaci]
MFLCAVAPPRLVVATGAWFDGKIGMCPFVKGVPALRTSRNPQAGTIETKPISVTRDVYYDMVANHVLPAIRRIWLPSLKDLPILIQHDNASAHNIHDAMFESSCKAFGWNISTRFQPPNSPDLNVLDLGFFRAIQTLQYEKEASNVDELILAVHEAYVELDVETSENIFLTLQGVMISILEVSGYNNKLQHIGKAKLRRIGQLPESLIVSSDLVATCSDRVLQFEIEDQLARIAL